MKKLTVGLILLNMMLLFGCIYIVTEHMPEETTYVAISKLPKNYSVEDAIQDGCVVIQKDGYKNNIIAGQEILNYFIDSREQEKFMRVVIWDGQVLDIRDVRYKNEKYYLETKDFKGVYLHFKRNKKITYSYQNEAWVEYQYCLSNEYYEDLQHKEQEISFSANKIVNVSEQKHIMEIDKTQYTPEQARKDGCIVIEDGKAKEWIDNTTFVRIAIYENEMLTSLIDLNFETIAEQAMYTYIYMDENGKFKKEFYQYEYSFRDDARDGHVVVLSNKKLTYEMWDQYYRDGVLNGIRNVLYYSYK